MARGSPVAIYGRGVDPATRRYVIVVPAGSGEPSGRLGALRLSRVTLLVLLALLGAGLVAGITYAGSRLVSQPIGLAAEPRDLSSSLTAPAAATTASEPAVTQPSTTTPVATTPSLAVPSTRRDGDGDGDDD